MGRLTNWLYRSSDMIPGVFEFLAYSCAFYPPHLELALSLGLPRFLSSQLKKWGSLMGRCFWKTSLWVSAFFSISCCLCRTETDIAGCLPGSRPPPPFPFVGYFSTKATKVDNCQILPQIVVLQRVSSMSWFGQWDERGKILGSYLELVFNFTYKKLLFWELPVGLVVRIQRFYCCGLGSIPGLRAKIPHQAAVHHSQKKKLLLKFFDNIFNFNFLLFKKLFLPHMPQPTPGLVAFLRVLLKKKVFETVFHFFILKWFKWQKTINSLWIISISF